jgi:hypothetical protein
MRLLKCNNPAGKSSRHTLLCYIFTHMGSRYRRGQLQRLIDGTGRASRATTRSGPGEQAGREDLQYLLIDTRCIEKPNSTELQEAINSMFLWYPGSTNVYPANISKPALDTDGKPSKLLCGSSSGRAGG